MTLTVFADPLTRIFDDEEHSFDERSEIAIGYSVVLAPDVANVFQSSEALNAALRSVIAAGPRQAK